MAVSPTRHICSNQQSNPSSHTEAIVKAAQARDVPPHSVSQEFHDAMRSPFSFQEFEHCRRHLTSGKSPGPSGLTTTQMKHWGPETAELVFELSQIMWRHHHIPQWWQDRLMTLLPKEPGQHDLSKIRPISLFEVIRKMWAGMVTTRIQRIWHSHGLLHPNQHGFRALILPSSKSSITWSEWGVPPLRTLYSGTSAEPLTPSQSGFNVLPGHALVSR